MSATNTQRQWVLNCAVLLSSFEEETAKIRPRKICERFFEENFPHRRLLTCSKVSTLERNYFELCL